MAVTSTQHARSKYLGQPERSGLALCLSGGGFRAALFHLGALRRLNELGVLSAVDTISSVSGGSILAAHLATTIPDWPDRGNAVPDWDRHVAEPFREFTRRNIRTPAVAKRIRPWNWFKSDAGVHGLQQQYQKYLTQVQLPKMPARPRYVLCATDLVFGVNWEFGSGSDGTYAGDYQAGYLRPVPDWPLARAVAASSCFPPVFNPQKVKVPPTEFQDGKYEKPDKLQLIKSIRLSDGGVYDNLGLEPVWKTHESVLVSDGGAVFEGERAKGLLWTLGRYTSVVSNQGCAIRKRWLISSFIDGQLKGAYWGIGTDGNNYELPGDFYGESLVDDVISEIRTDLDAFSKAEQCVLENHGYMLGDVAVRAHASELITIDAPIEVPHPDWMDETRIRIALKDSHKRRILGRQ